MDAEQFVLRLPPSLADQLRAAATASVRSSRGAGSAPNPPKTFRYTRLKNARSGSARQSSRGRGRERASSTDPDDNRYIFFAGDERYNATMVYLPCIVESQKTLDGSTYYKSGEVSQMLVVHPNAAAPAKSGKRGGAARSASTLVTGSEAALPIEQRAFTAQQVPQNLHLSSGLTPPTAHIVQRRFDKTKRGLQCSADEVQAVQEQLSKLQTMQQQAGSGAGHSRSLRAEREEVVPWEPYMDAWPDELVVRRVNGRVTSTQVPEAFLRKSEPPPRRADASPPDSLLHSPDPMAASASFDTDLPPIDEDFDLFNLGDELGEVLSSSSFDGGDGDDGSLVDATDAALDSDTFEFSLSQFQEDVENLDL